MKRTVNRKPIDAFIEANRPDGLAELARVARIPSGSISKIRTGRVPLDPYRRERLARAIGVTEDELFPLADGESEAS